MERMAQGCLVEADGDDGKETNTLMRECLPSGYREVQTLADDLFFRRDEFPADSGCMIRDHNHDCDDDDMDSNAP